VQHPLHGTALLNIVLLAYPDQKYAFNFIGIYQLILLGKLLELIHDWYKRQGYSLIYLSEKNTGITKDVFTFLPWYLPGDQSGIMPITLATSSSVP